MAPRLVIEGGVRAAQVDVIDLGLDVRLSLLGDPSVDATLIVDVHDEKGSIIATCYAAARRNDDGWLHRGCNIHHAAERARLAAAEHRVRRLQAELARLRRELE